MQFHKCLESYSPETRWFIPSLVPKSSLPGVSEGGLARRQSLKEMYPPRVISLQSANNLIQPLMPAWNREGQTHALAFRLYQASPPLSREHEACQTICVKLSSHRSPGWAPAPVRRSCCQAPAAGSHVARLGWALAVPQRAHRGPSPKGNKCP